MLSAGFGYITTSEIESSFPKSIAALGSCNGCYCCSNINSVVFNFSIRESLTCSLCALYFIDTLIRVGPAKAEVGTVNVLVRFALLEEDPETISSEFQKFHLIIVNPDFPIFCISCTAKTALNKIVFEP
jgi:hypothetical protein